MLSLNNFWNRNSLIVWENNESKTIVRQILDTVNWVLNDSTSQEDRDRLWKYDVFLKKESWNPSFIIFADTIKFVKLEDKKSYLEYLKRSVLSSIKTWNINEKVLSSFVLLIRNGLVSEEQFRRKIFHISDDEDCSSEAYKYSIGLDLWELFEEIKKWNTEKFDKLIEYYSYKW
jgi:hypothetical protein